MTNTLQSLVLILLFCMTPIPFGEGTLNVTIRGQVRTDDGLAVADAWAGAFDGQWNPTGITTRTNRQGNYELIVPVLDSYIIDVYPGQSPSDLKNGVYGFSYFGLAKKIWRGNASSIAADIVLDPVGSLVLKAFDENGTLMREKDFGWQRNVYATDENGIRVDDRFTMLQDSLSSSKNWDNSLRLPAVAVPLNHPRSINLLWPVPGFGKVMVLADNGGQGFSLARKGDVLIINLNYELARTQLVMLNRTLEACAKQGCAIPEKLLAEVNSAGQFFADASIEKNDSERAILSNKALNCSLYAGEELEYQKSLRSIELNRKKDVTLKILDEAGKPISGAEVEYAQTSHDFFFGNWGTDRAWTPLKASQLMKDAGINYVALDFTWHITEPSDNGYADVYVPSGDLTLQGHNVVWFTKGWDVTPSYLYPMTFSQLKDEVDAHVSYVVKKHADRVQYWTLVNEAEGTWTNHWRLSLDQIVEIIDVSCKAARRANPMATIILNFAVPGGEAAGLKYGVTGETRGYVPFELLQRIVEKGVDFDIIGLQLYYGDIRQVDGPGHPARDALSVSRMLDWYAQFNKTIFITELSVPSKYSAYENFESGYWHALPSEETQSDWVRLLYTIAYSKPYVGCITWWDASDLGSFAKYGGLTDSNGQPKLAYYALKGLIRAWTSEGVGDTDYDGILRFRGFTGNYRIEIDGYDPVEVQVSEHGSNEITVTLKKQAIPGVTNTTIMYGVVFIGAIAAVVSLLVWRRSKTQSKTWQLNVIDSDFW